MKSKSRLSIRSSRAKALFQQQVNKIEEEKNKLLELAGLGQIKLSKFAKGIISEVSPAIDQRIDQRLDTKLTEFSSKYHLQLNLQRIM